MTNKNWKLKLLLLVTMASVLPSGDETHAAEKQTTRIVGGETAPEGAWPWQVALKLLQSNTGKGRFFCGGSLITEQWILTAAHCVEMFNKTEWPELRVVAGSNNINQGGVTRSVKNVIVHEKYATEKGLHNDIALVQLDRPVDFQVVTLKTAGEERAAQPGTAVVTGWGTLAEGGQISESLQQVELPVISNQKCNSSDAYQGTIKPYHLCAGFDRGGKDSCQGDSGGPLVQRSADGKWQQIGIVSYGEGCAREKVYGVYTRVSEFTGWLRKKLSANGVELPGNPGTVQTVTGPVSGTGAASGSGGFSLPSQPAGNRVLLIGIDTYQNSKLNLPRGSSTTDVDNMRRLVIDSLGFAENQVLTLTNENATANNINTALQGWLVDQSETGSRVVLYYSGHGYYQDDDNDDEKDRYDEILVPHDVEILDASSQPWKAGRIIRDDRIGQILDQLQDRNVTMIIDACHSGTTTRGIGSGGLQNRQLTVRYLGAANLGSGPQPATRSIGSFRARDSLVDDGFSAGRDNLTAWSAASATQLAQVDADKQPMQGLFTRHFIDGIKSAAADSSEDGLVSHAELLSYLRDKSAAYCTKHPGFCRDDKLTPLLEAPSDLLARDIVTGRLPPDTISVVESVLPQTASGEFGIALRILHNGEIATANRVKIGDTGMQFEISAGQQGHLILLDISSEGEFVQLFPNQYSRQCGSTDRLKPGVPLSIPQNNCFDLEVEGPAGANKLVAVVSKQPYTGSLAQLLGENRDLDTISRPQDYLNRLSQELNAEFSSKNEGIAVRSWDMKTINYEVIR